MISEWDVTSPPSPTGWLEIQGGSSHYNFRIGCDPPFPYRVVKIKGGLSSTMVSEWGVIPLPLQGGS